nr:hypothetical protein [uncultured Pseudomonas sp.]
MRALTWQAPNKLQVDTVPDPSIVNPRDAILRVIMSSVCGSATCTCSAATCRR